MGGGVTSPLTGSIKDLSFAYLLKTHHISKDRRSKRSGLRIRGRVQNRKDTRAEKMTVSGELMPALTPYFSGFGNSLSRIVRHHNRKAGGYMLPVFFCVTKMSRRAAYGRKCHKKNHLKPSKNTYFIHPFSQ